MDKSVETRLEEVDKIIQSLEKRFDDIKWYIGGIASIFAIFISVLILLVSWNFSNEKASLREFEKDMKVELGKAEATPEMEMLDIDRHPLANQESIAGFYTNKKDNTLFIYINFFLQNTGNGNSGPLYVKFYSSDPLILEAKSVDEPRYKYESYVDPKNLNPSEFPGKFSSDLNLWFHMPNNIKPPKGQYKVLLKVFYGKGKVTQSEFTLIVPN